MFKLMVNPLSIVLSLFSIFAILAFSSIFYGALVMLLWNYLVPILVKAPVLAPEITWFQGWCLAFLCCMLFKSSK